MSFFDSSRCPTAVVKSLAVGTASTNFVPFPAGIKGVIVRGVTVTNASASLASSTATLGVSTQTSGGGTAIVTAATGVITPLTSSTVFNDATVANAGVFVLTVANAPTTFNGAPNSQTGVWVTVAGTPNVTATVDIYFWCDILNP